MGLLNQWLGRKKGNKSSGDSGNSDDPGDSNSGGVLGNFLPKYHKGGVVRKTGPALLKKGERVLTKAQQRKRNRRK